MHLSALKKQKEMKKKTLFQNQSLDQKIIKTCDTPHKGHCKLETENGRKAI